MTEKDTNTEPFLAVVSNRPHDQPSVTASLKLTNALASAPVEKEQWSLSVIFDSAILNKNYPPNPGETISIEGTDKTKDALALKASMALTQYLRNHEEKANITTHSLPAVIAMDVSYIDKGNSSPYRQGYALIKAGLQRMEEVGIDAFIQENTPEAAKQSWAARIDQKNQPTRQDIEDTLMNIRENGLEHVDNISTAGIVELATKLYASLEKGREGPGG